MTFLEQIAHAADVLRKTATGKPKAPPAPAQSLGSKLLKALTPEQKHRILVRLPDGTLETQLMTSEQALAHLNGNPWHRIG